MEYILLVPLWLFAGVVVGIIASAKGKSGCAWFIYGFLLAPIAFIHVLIASPEAERRVSNDLARGRLGMCPYCREAIKPDALKCKHCGSDLRVDPLESRLGEEAKAVSADSSGEQTRVILTKRPRNSHVGVLLLILGLLFLGVTTSGRDGTGRAEPAAPSPPTAAPSGVVFAPPAPVAVPSSPPNPSLLQAFTGMTYFPHVAFEALIPGDPFLNLFEISADEAVGDDIGYRYFIYEGGRPGIALRDVCPAGYETTWFVFESDNDEPIKITLDAEVHDLAAGDDKWFGPVFSDGFRRRVGDPLHQPPVYIAHCSFADTRGEYRRSNKLSAEAPVVSAGRSSPTLSCATYVTYLQNRRQLASESGTSWVFCSSEH